MAFLEGEISLKLYTDTQQTEFPLDLVPNIQKIFQNLSVDTAQTLYINLAASGSQTVNLNGVSNVQGLYIYSDSQDLNININSLGNIGVKAAIPGFMPIVFTTLSITNQSSSTATNVELVIISG